MKQQVILHFGAVDWLCEVYVNGNKVGSHEGGLKKRYGELMNNLSGLIPLGFSAAVYTQTTDVEIETNGLMTYDRKVIKIPEEELKELHQKLYEHDVKVK